MPTSSRGGGWTPSRRPPRSTPASWTPEVLEEIIGSWGAVKKPSVVTFVVDVSRSMETSGAIEPVQEGLRDIIDEMQRTGAESSQIGLVTFNDEIVETTIPPAPLADVGDDIVDAIQTMDGPRRDRALRRAEGGHPAHRCRPSAPTDATRAVVVLSDGAGQHG